ncbi:hypothetical protein [Parvularcula sp. IMCC14364]|uniref:hypothetical protein n=1 Tax=Parvularcula sp. IMCC14364 TaxID=3067902 RepID=UPI0027428CAD|nr:hypothetical protein [Parvularcula sp. IMCC14364]
MRAFRLIGMFFLIVAFSAGILRFTVARTEDTGNPLWVIIGLALAGVILTIGYNLRPKDEEGRELMDMIFGDMTDPLQRAIIFRMTIASLIHGLVLSRLILDNDMSPINIMDGIGPDETGTFLLVSVFVLSLFWCVYECWRFYNIDEFWRTMSVGPIASAGVVLLLMTTLWGLARDYLGAPDIHVAAIYAVYWLTAMLLMLSKKRQAR